IQKAKDKAIALKLKKEAEYKAQKEAEEKARIKREQELASMNPIDKIIDSFGDDVTKVINGMKDGSIENIDDIKVELAVKLKSIMQKDSKQWDKAKQKALKRKEYIESLLN
ncbi:MAG: hypothetical protein U9Q30_00145, partial [Campylobacterota bacterium]|nr:hypothetical protein [Campylobacterota bacterium]